MRQYLLKTDDIRLFLLDFFQNQRSSVDKIVGSILSEITANIKCYKFHGKTLLFIPSILCSMFEKPFPQSGTCSFSGSSVRFFRIQLQVSLFSVCLFPQVISDFGKAKQCHNQKDTRDQNDPPCLCHQRFFGK